MSVWVLHALATGTDTAVSGKVIGLLISMHVHLQRVQRRALLERTNTACAPDAS